ncbi:inner membrane complex protein 1a, putative [Hepatocystis sp. ex Piliocolobus tephrosceles]|nr:inner membrane complex protein 1a, putative [Hepatocystis sp. ex Piliocolobus tephrosceles]
MMDGNGEYVAKENINNDLNTQTELNNIVIDNGEEKRDGAVISKDINDKNVGLEKEESKMFIEKELTEDKIGMYKSNFDDSVEYNKEQNEKNEENEKNGENDFSFGNSLSMTQLGQSNNGKLPNPRIEQVFKPKIVKNVEVQKHLPISVDVPVPYMVPKPVVVNVQVPVLKFRDTFVPVPVRKRIIPKITWIKQTYQVDCIKERPYLKIQDVIKPVPCEAKITSKKYIDRAYAINPNELPQDDIHGMWMRVNAHLADQMKKEYGDMFPYYKNDEENEKRSDKSSEGHEENTSNENSNEDSNGNLDTWSTTDPNNGAEHQTDKHNFVDKNNQYSEHEINNDSRDNRDNRESLEFTGERIYLNSNEENAINNINVENNNSNKINKRENSSEHINNELNQYSFINTRNEIENNSNDYSYNKDEQAETNITKHNIYSTYKNDNSENNEDNNVDVSGDVSGDNNKFCLSKLCCKKTNKTNSNITSNEEKENNFEYVNDFMNEMKKTDYLEEKPLANLYPGHPLYMGYIQNKWINTNTLKTHELYDDQFINASMCANYDLHNENVTMSEVMLQKKFLKSADMMLSPFMGNNMQKIDNYYSNVIFNKIKKNNRNSKN